MKIKEGYILRNILGQYIVVPTGELSQQLNGKLVLNESGAFLWRLLQQERSKEDLVNCVLKEYDADIEQSEKAVDIFLTQIKSIDGLLEE